MSFQVTSANKFRHRLMAGIWLAVDNGIRDGIIDIMKKDTGEFSRTVARKSGDLREGVELATRQVLDEKPFHRGSTTILWSEIREKTEAIIDYAVHHFKSRGFYKNPTEPGTFPMRYSRWFPMAFESVKEEIIFNIHNIHLEDEAVVEINNDSI